MRSREGRGERGSAEYKNNRIIETKNNQQKKIKEKIYLTANRQNHSKKIDFD